MVQNTIKNYEHSIKLIDSTLGTSVNYVNLHVQMIFTKIQNHQMMVTVNKSLMLTLLIEQLFKSPTPKVYHFV